MENKEFPKLYDKKSNCCGCSACFSICPVNAITMKQDEEGFLYPSVDKKKCIKCYQCMKVCIFKEDQKKRGYYE